MQLRHLIISALLTVASASAAHAQQLWLSAEGRANITKSLRADIGVEHRSDDGLGGTSRWSGDVGLSYKCLKWLRVGASYKFLYDHEDSRTTKKGNLIDSYWQPGHRFQIFATGSYKVGKVELSLREVYQYTHFTEKSVAKYDSFGNAKDDELIEGETRQLLRSRLAAEYNYKKKALATPFASVEMYNDLADGFSVRKMRYTAGVDFRINKHNYIEVFYRFIDRTKSANTNVIGVGYQFKL